MSECQLNRFPKRTGLGLVGLVNLVLIFKRTNQHICMRSE